MFKPLNNGSAEDFDPHIAAATSIMPEAEWWEAVLKLVAATFDYVPAKFEPQLH